MRVRTATVKMMMARPALPVASVSHMRAFSIGQTRRTFQIWVIVSMR